MGTVTIPNVFSAGNPIIAAEHNENFDAIVDEYNDNIQNSNVAAAAAIAVSKLAALTASRAVVTDGSGFISASSIASTDIVSLTGSQTLTNKTLTNPIITIIRPTVSALSDGATVALNAALGNHFTLSAAGNRTILTPTNPISGQKIIIAHLANGGARTLSLTTGSAGAFRFGSDITALSETASGLTDYIGCVYNLSSDRWDVVAFVKGY